MAKTFAANNDVAFMDVNLSEEQIRGNHNPGSGGWPTIRYFNKETGIEGGTYTKKTSKSMCDELGDEEMMSAYVEEYGNTSLCSVMTTDGCNERQVSYIKKMKTKSMREMVTEISRLDKMKASSMKPDLLNWLKQRKLILTQLVAQEEHTEL